MTIATESTGRQLRAGLAAIEGPVARGAGTGLSGGCLPSEGGLVISMMRMNRILEVDFENQIAVVEPGVVNLHLTQAIQSRGFYYAPDPSSQQACTIGGNIAGTPRGPPTPQ